MDRHRATPAQPGPRSRLPAASYYERLGPSSYTSTAATQSPWQLDLQHGGPPAALLARSIEESVADEPLVRGQDRGRLPRPDPAGTLCDHGRRAASGSAGAAGAGADVLPGRTATGRSSRPEPGCSRPRRVAPGHVDGRHLGPPLPGPQPQGFFDGVDPAGATGLRSSGGSLAGSFARGRRPPRSGRACGCRWSPMSRRPTCSGCSWSRTRPTASAPHCRWTQWLSIPPALTVAVRRPPAGEWFMLDAQTAIEAQGTGLARVDDQSTSTALCAHVLQPLLVAPLPPRG